MADEMIDSLHEVKRLLRYTLIRFVLSMIALLRFDRLFPKAAKNGMIFTMHHVQPAGDPYEFSPNSILSVTPEFLEDVIRNVLKKGMKPVHVHELPRLLREDRLHKDQRQRYVCFTLDDGYRDNARYAAPLFEKYNIPYTIYITSGFATAEHILWWETIEVLLRENASLQFDFGNGTELLDIRSHDQKMCAFARFARFVEHHDEDAALAQIAGLARQNGLDPLQLTRELVMNSAELRALGQSPLVHFGAHTVSHINLKRASPQRVISEVENSARWIEHNLAAKPQSFAYPYGWKTAVSQRNYPLIEQAGFAIAVTTRPGLLSKHCLTSPQAFPRVSLNGAFQKQRYIDALLSGIPFL